jgi:uncharacterized membrane protein
VSDLIFIAFPSEAQAEKMRQHILSLQKKYLIVVEDAVIAVRHANGNVKLNQMKSLSRMSIASGAMWGLAVGALLAVPVAGAVLVASELLATGAALGAATELLVATVPTVTTAAGTIRGMTRDFGIPDPEMHEQAQALKPGEAGLFLLVRKMTIDKVLARLAGMGGRVVGTSFASVIEDALKAALAQRVDAPAKVSKARLEDPRVSASMGAS